jgi:hypothetical protein
MAGNLAQGELIAGPADTGLRYVVATPDHDAAICRLLRDNPMLGAISLSTERTPGFVRGSAASDTTILAFDGDKLVCMGRCVVRSRRVSGDVRRVGYLGELRLDSGARGRADILRRGFAFFAEQQAAEPADMYFTSMASDNLRARQLLERGMRGFPRYRRLCDYVTLVLTVPTSFRARSHPPGPRWEPAIAADYPAVAEFLNTQGAGRELASAWTSDALMELGAHGLGASDIMIVRDGGRIRACAALWDQRSFRQTVIRGYSRSLALARPLINLRAWLRGREWLPPVGSAVRLAYLSPFAFSLCAGASIGELVSSLYPMAARRGIGHIALGFDASDPDAEVLGRALHPRKYHSCIYQVSGEGLPAAAVVAPGRLVGPEVAFL